MPNWCHNDAIIEGSSETLQWLQDINFSFEVIRPIPQDQASDWYDWNCANWGTKWNCDRVRFEVDEQDQGTLKVSYSTAWSPPIKLLNYLSDTKQLKITNTFGDEMYGFVGQSVIENGVDDTEVLEPCSHDDLYLQQYALNHPWFDYRNYRDFFLAMSGHDPNDRPN